MDGTIFHCFLPGNPDIGPKVSCIEKFLPLRLRLNFLLLESCDRHPIIIHHSVAIYSSGALSLLTHSFCFRSVVDYLPLYPMLVL